MGLWSAATGLLKKAAGRLGSTSPEAKATSSADPRTNGGAGSSILRTSSYSQGASSLKPAPMCVAPSAPGPAATQGSTGPVAGGAKPSWITAVGEVWKKATVLVETAAAQKVAAAPPKTPDPQAMMAAAAQIRDAVDGWGTNEDRIASALKGRSPEEIAAIREIYRTTYKEGLDDRLRAELSGSDLEEANAHLQGSGTRATVARLEGALGVLNDDEAKIEETLRGLTAPEREALQADPKGRAVLDRVRGSLGGADREVFDALARGDKAAASAIRIDEATAGLGTDEDTVMKHLESADKGEAAAISKAFELRMRAKGRDETLKSVLEGDLLFGAQDVALAGATDGRTGIAAERAYQASKSWSGTDEKAIFDTFEGKDSSERAAIAAYYEREHGNLDAMFSGEMEGDDLRRARDLRRDGELDAAFALKVATDGWSADKERIKEITAGLSKDEVAELQAAYRKETGKDLTATLKSELYGADQFDVLENLKGEPTTPEEKRERANARHDFQRGSGSGPFGRGIMSLGETMGLHSTGSGLDDRTERLNDCFGPDGKVKPGRESEVELLYGMQHHDYDQYEAAKDKAGETVATGAGLAFTGLASVATGGLAAPLAIGAAGYISSKALIKGNSYGGDEFVNDLGSEVVTSAATLGLNKLAKGAKAARTLKNGQKVTKAADSATDGHKVKKAKSLAGAPKDGKVTAPEGKVAAKGKAAAPKGKAAAPKGKAAAPKGKAAAPKREGASFRDHVIGSVVGSVYDEATNAEAWRDGLPTWVRGVGSAVVDGTMTGALSAGVELQLRRSLGETGPLGDALIGGTGGAVGNLADPDLHSASPQDMALQSIQAFGQGARGGVLDAHTPRKAPRSKKRRSSKSGQTTQRRKQLRKKLDGAER